jgi:type 1 glutamine amidotransferase
MTSRSAVILTGSGRYADPWHPFEQTTSILAELLGAAGYRVEIASDVDSRLAEGIETDLLVVNAGLPRDDAAAPSADGRDGLRRTLESGCPLLAVHAASTTFIDAPEWEAALGGAWVRGHSMHPPFSEAAVQVLPHPLTEGIEDFTVSDERYSFLRVAAEVEVLAVHEHEGRTHPLAWIRESTGTLGRAAYDALGHDVRSFTSPVHRRLLESLIGWVGGR